MTHEEFTQAVTNMASEQREDMIYRCEKLWKSGGLNTQHLNAAMIAFIAAAQDKAESLMNLAKRGRLTNQVNDLRYF